MNDTKDRLAQDDDLPIERVERVGDYFKSLFVRSLKLGLGDGARERPWAQREAPAGHIQRPEWIEADSSRQAESVTNDRETGEAQEKESA